MYVKFYLTTFPVRWGDDASDNRVIMCLCSIVMRLCSNSFQEEASFTKTAMDKVQSSYLRSLQEVADLLRKRAETIKNLKIWTSSPPWTEEDRVAPRQLPCVSSVPDPVAFCCFILLLLFFISSLLTQTSGTSAALRGLEPVSKLCNKHKLLKNSVKQFGRNGSSFRAC